MSAAGAAPRPGSVGRAGGLVAAALIVAALAAEYSGADRVVLDVLYDAQRGGWVHGEGWLWNEALHDGGRAMIKAIAVALLALFLVTLRLPRAAHVGAAASLVFLSILFGAGGVNLAKKFTNVDCPCSLERYGGDRPYVHLFAHRPPGLPRAHCFPGGHSSGGFALLSLFFVARARRWQHGLLYMTPGVVVGGLFALTQWLRGAHFPSHDLWSAAACWLVAWGLYEALMRPHIAGADALR